MNETAISQRGNLISILTNKTILNNGDSNSDSIMSNVIKNTNELQAPAATTPAIVS